MLNVLIEFSNRQQIVEAQEEYFELIQYMLETNADSVSPKPMAQSRF